jgi:hypothetical protein
MWHLANDPQSTGRPMALLIDAFSVIISKDTIEAKYPRGLSGYSEDCPNRTLLVDDYLIRVSFMSLADAKVYIDRLADRRLTPSRKGEAEDVALVSRHEGLSSPCRWLRVGSYQTACVVWHSEDSAADRIPPVGWDNERSLQYLTPAEVKERLEFVRTEGNVEVYRDKLTGQELYVGRTERRQEGDWDRQDSLYKQATELTEGLLMGGSGSGPPLEAPERGRLTRAIAHLEQVVEINPGNWAAMWVMGKAHQRLEDHGTALGWFSRAHRLNPDQPDVAREASISAMEEGHPQEAIGFCERALESSPDDAGLRSNLALTLLFSNRPEEASTVAADSLARDPSDTITKLIVSVIDDVLTGKRPCPRHSRDIE